MAKGREAQLHKALNLWGTSADLPQRVATAKVLVVGAGGIGCELLKGLVLSGFRKIEIVDLDTIEVTNLNRQFLFRREHVGQSKAMVAAEAVKKFNRSSDLEVTAHHGNIKDKKFGADYMQKFDVVFNALDNVEARRHVNRVCVAVDKPLVDGGTQGYDGQVVTIKRGVSACYDCESKPANKGYAVCTIRSTPDKPIHCIVWGKFLFGLLFGVKDDTNSVTEGIDSTMEPQAIIKKIFMDDINKLIGMEELWKTRSPPAPLNPSLFESLESGGKAVDRKNLNDHELWPLHETCAVFAQRCRELQRLQVERGSLEFDKDDDMAMDFVLCASNLRAHAFGIERQSHFRCRDIAGNIIAAIATTNAIIAGVMVLEAFKVLDDRLADCKTLYKYRLPSGRKCLVLNPSDQDRPVPDCPVCGGGSAIRLRINTEKTTLGYLLEKVLRQELSLSEPLVDTGENLIECLARFDDKEEERTFRAKLGRLLSDPAIGIRHNTELVVEDESQHVKATILIFHHDDFDPDHEAPAQRYTLERHGTGLTATPQTGADGATAGPSGAAPAAGDDGDCLIVDGDADGGGEVCIVEAGAGEARKHGRPDEDGDDPSRKGKRAKN